MWTRAELKSRAKMCLSRYYWAAFVISLIFAILSGFGSSTGNVQKLSSYISQSTTEDVQSGNDQSGLIAGGQSESELASGIELVPGLGDAYGPAGGNVGSMVTSNLVYRFFAGAVVVFAVIGILLGIFVQPLFEVGRNRFYLESRVTGQSAGVEKILWGFSNGYLKIVGTQFLRNLITGGVMLLCMAPGLISLCFNANGYDTMGSAVIFSCGTMIGTGISIYIQYSFLMVPYILAENPEMKAMEVLRLSREMMRGQKWNAFVLGISFIGWQLLGTMLCGIGTFFVQPYVDATFAELYAVLRGPYSGRLNGFGGDPYVMNNARYGGQYVEPDSVKDVNGGYSGGTYGSYGNGSMNGGMNGTMNSGMNGNAESGYGYNSGANSAPGGWNQMPNGNETYGRTEQDPQGTVSPDQAKSEDRGTDVKRSEGGPGRGYYLNGKFYPYTEDEKNGQ